MKFVLTISSIAMAAIAAADQGVSWSSYNLTSSGPESITIGYQFDVTTALNVTALGFFTNPNKGDKTFADSHEVGLWNAAGTLLASATVTDSSTLIGMFKWTSITPVTLLPGIGYQVAGFTPDPGDLWAYGDSFNSPGADFQGYTEAPGIANALGWFSYAPVFSEPLNTYHKMYGGGNIMTAAVPEPAGYAVLAVGALGLLARRRRRV